MLTILLYDVHESDFRSFFPHPLEALKTGEKGCIAVCVADDEGLCFDFLYLGSSQSFD